ncbi:MAG: hypothetical protein A3F40_00450 [Chlamydiae bacterium RIFCSPHIGHO2_12_FULL_27_8]|nr:MAG: hypothetical protein A3F40_00450 [Chlamydiae bacterium RIFCSPHIGHO2_12_FULL_27_8]
MTVITKIDNNNNLWFYQKVSNKTYQIIYNIFKKFLTTVLYPGYNFISGKELEKFNKKLAHYNIRKLECENDLDAIYVSSKKEDANRVNRDMIIALNTTDQNHLPNNIRNLECENDLNAINVSSKKEVANRVNRVMIIALNTTYQDHKPKHWDVFVENGFDIVLFNHSNPKQLTTKTFAADLSIVLKKVREEKPESQIVVKSYCQSTLPSISAVADMNDANIHLICDRGYANPYEMTRSFSLMAKMRIVKAVIKDHFDLESDEKIKKIKGKVIFLTPDKKSLDQMVSFKGKNFTRELYEKTKHKNFLIELENSDHFTRWSKDTYNKILKIFKDNKIIEDFKKLGEKDVLTVYPIRFFNKYLLYFLVKSWL